MLGARAVPLTLAPPTDGLADALLEPARRPLMLVRVPGVLPGLIEDVWVDVRKEEAPEDGLEDNCLVGDFDAGLYTVSESVLQ